jgi:CheY-like chemotaxis protein
MNAHLISVLLVEDDPGDVLLIREALAEHKVGNVLCAVSDGVEAMRFVRREAPFEDQERPDLLLLDLNLPDRRLLHRPREAAAKNSRGLEWAFEAPKRADVAQLARASACHAEGRGFESLHPLERKPC